MYYDPSGYKDKRQTPCKEETSVGESGAGESDTSSVAKPNHGQGFSSKGYNPKPGERTFEGYVNPSHKYFHRNTVLKKQDNTNNDKMQ